MTDTSVDSNTDTSVDSNIKTLRTRSPIEPNVEILDENRSISPVTSVELLKEETMTRLNGIWIGWSRSDAERGSDNSTEWKDTVLRFILDGDNKTRGRIEGTGVSMWRNLKVAFDVRGWVDFESLEVVLYKQHKGQYTNEIEYRCSIDPKNGRIEGKYESGVVTLRRKNVSDFKSLNGTWSGVSISDTRKIPTTWSDTTLRFEFDSDCDEGNISGHGVSLWRGLTIEFDIQGKFRNSDQSVQIVKQHKGRFKNKITYRGTWKRKASSDRFVIFGSYDGGKFHLEQEKRIQVEEKDEQLEQNEPFILMSSEERSKIENTLNGLWFGESVDKNHHVTKWSDTALSFTFSENTKSNSGQIYGEGLSLWRDRRIDFDLVGSFDWTKRTVRLIKQHKGMFRNRIMYQGTLDIQASGIPKIEGTYERGRVMLTRRRGLKKERNVTEILSSIKVEDRSLISTTLSSSIMKKYTLFLSGVLIGGVVDSNAQEALQRFREDHKVTQEQHDMTLKSLGVTKAEFNMMKTTKDVPSKSTEDTDMCKICYAERIDAVILPCGHFAICRVCGAKLDECPICRQEIQKIQVVYRS